MVLFRIIFLIIIREEQKKILGIKQNLAAKIIAVIKLFKVFFLSAKLLFKKNYLLYKM